MVVSRAVLAFIQALQAESIAHVVPFKASQAGSVGQACFTLIDRAIQTNREFCLLGQQIIFLAFQASSTIAS